MSSVHKRKLPKTQQISNGSKKKQIKKVHGLSAQVSGQLKIRNGLLAAVMVYILLCAIALYWYGVAQPPDIPPELEDEILSNLPQDAKHIERPRNFAPKNDKKVEKKEISEEKENPNKFKENIQSDLKMESVKLKTGQKQNWKRLTDTSSPVSIYTMENFLSAKECEGLIKAHEKILPNFDPIICFSDETTMKSYIKEFNAKMAERISKNDFTQGTFCLNETLSSSIGTHLRWSQSTSFYVGESPFSNKFEQRVFKHTGLNPNNGGKFQVTSYKEGIGYKLHRDCRLNEEKRDRFATILVYLADVEEGGETVFPELGVSVVPKKGMAIVWNNMDRNGNCEPTSIHRANVVEKGKKYILQRWYYYQNFPALGVRIEAPELPKKSHEFTPRVTCDEFELGSCRFYDEWNYDHLVDYNNGRMQWKH